VSKEPFYPIKQLRIGFFTDSYLPYYSGVVHSILSFKKNLEKLNHKIFIFCPSYHNSKPEAGVFRFISFPAPTHRHFNLAFPFSFNIMATVRGLNLDLIHVHSPFLMGCLGAAVAKKNNLPLIFTYHTFYHHYLHYIPITPAIAFSFLRYWERRFCNNCQLIIAPSASVKNHLLKQNILAPIKVLPTGIELKEFQIPKVVNYYQNKYNLPQNSKVLLTVSRLSKEKNIYFILKVFSKLPASIIKQCYLFIIGEGPEKEKLQNYSKQMLYNSHIYFTGTVSRKELVDHYINADIFIFSSPSETQGLVICEAKAAGLPVVALRASGVTEAIDNGKDGFLIEPLDENSFMQKILLLLSDYKLRERFSHEAKKKSVSFSAQQRAIQLQNYYLELLQSSSFNIAAYH